VVSRLSAGAAAPGVPTETAGRIDLTENLPPEAFCDDAQQTRLGSPIGAYRQAGDAEGSRFAVRLHFDKLGAWHRLDWEWRTTSRARWT